jgi:DivIVA domain-containing protein
MADNFKYNLTAVDIYEAEFPAAMRGYDKKEVNALLDQVIEDYETYVEEVTALKEENDFLRAKIAKLQAAPTPAVAEETQKFQPISNVSSAPKPAAPAAVTNFDILKRISKLERAVFGNKGQDTQKVSPIVEE